MINRNLVCTIPGCTANQIGRGWCSTHYARWWRTGTTEKPPHQDNALETVQKALPNFSAGCVTGWPFGRSGRQRRPSLNFQGRAMYTVRCAWFLLHGSMPIGQLNHVCNNTDCWNPLHVYDGSQDQNMGDLARAGTHSNRRLTDVQVCEIRRLASAGIPQDEIAVSYGIARTYVSRIAARKRRHRVSCC